jgi:membrane protease YdiL (CAAX protease family)
MFPPRTFPLIFPRATIMPGKSPNDLGPPHPGDTATPPPRSSPRPFLLESVFLGPQGVRAAWRAAFYIALFLVLISGAATAAGLLHGAAFGAGATITPRVLATQEGLAALCAIAAAAILARLERRRFAEYGMPLAQALGKNFWMGAAWGIAAVSALMLMIRMLGGYSFGFVDLSRADIARYALEWAAAFFLVGIYEEFFFRGYLQFTLSSGMHFWPAAVLLSLGFGAVHLRNPGEGPVGALSVFVIGMFLCFTLRRTGTLWFAIGFHAAYDFGETYVYSVPDSGIVMPGHLLASSFHGPAWLTGGTVGPEGSIFDFVVIAIAFVIFNRVYRQRKADPSVAKATSG